MENTKIDISSTLIEKGIDSVKGFIEKLAGSTLEEAGLMFGDKVRIRRLKNQIKIFSEVKKITEENNITLKEINLKTLVPLLEFSSLEEDETLQEKWVNLIVNYSDTNQKYESSIFPFILNQLTKEDVNILQTYNDSDSVINAWYKTNLDLNYTGIVRANLTRLGLIEKAVVPTTTIGKQKINYNSTYLYELSDLGKEFLKCCTR